MLLSTSAPLRSHQNAKYPQSNTKKSYSVDLNDLACSFRFAAVLKKNKTKQLFSPTNL